MESSRSDCAPPFNRRSRPQSSVVSVNFSRAAAAGPPHGELRPPAQPRASRRCAVAVSPPGIGAPPWTAPGPPGLSDLPCAQTAAHPAPATPPAIAGGCLAAASGPRRRCCQGGCGSRARGRTDNAWTEPTSKLPDCGRTHVWSSPFGSAAGFETGRAAAAAAAAGALAPAAAAACASSGANATARYPVHSTVRSPTDAPAAAAVAAATSAAAHISTSTPPAAATRAG